MTLAEFKTSLHHTEPSPSLSPALCALWHDGQDDWERAHTIAQDDASPEGSWVHAYLHRKEGDTWNAQYWYRKAGRTMPERTLEDEWERIVQTLLEASV